MTLRTIAWVIGALLLGGGITGVAAYQFRRSGLLQHDSVQTRAAVLARIPIGTEISRAKTIMEAEGFQCMKVHDTKFADDQPGGGLQTTHSRADILWCDSGKRLTPALIVSKRWQVSFVDSGGVVSYIAVAVSRTIL